LGGGRGAERGQYILGFLWGKNFRGKGKKRKKTPKRRQSWQGKVEGEGFWWDNPKKFNQKRGKGELEKSGLTIGKKGELEKMRGGKKWKNES